MNTKRISAKMEKALSDQMNVEDLQSRVYLSYGVWAADQGYSGISNFLFRHAQEERNHSIKFMEYVLDRGGKPKIDALPSPGKEPKNLSDCFQLVYKHEVDNTNKIYNLVDIAMSEKDWATWNFLQWFVREQVEEETLALNLLDKLKIAGGDQATDDSLFALDKVLGQTQDDAPMATSATGENP